MTVSEAMGAKRPTCFVVTAESLRDRDYYHDFEEVEALIETHAALVEEVKRLRGMDDYDAGLLSTHGGGNVDWWLDYLRAEIGRANDFWRSQIESALTTEVPHE